MYKRSRINIKIGFQVIFGSKNNYTLLILFPFLSLVLIGEFVHVDCKSFLGSNPASLIVAAGCTVYYTLIFILNAAFSHSLYQLMLVI